MTENLEKYELESSEGLSDAIAYLIDKKKGKDIVTVDLKGKTIIADYFVIASVTSTVAVRAVSGYIEEQLKKHGVEVLRRDEDDKWTALDYGNVIVHIFHEDLREFYQIERLWADGDNIKKFIDG